MNDKARFVTKVILLSAALSALIKYGGPLLPFQMPYTPAANQGLNALVIAIILLPSLVIALIVGTGLWSKSN